MSAETLTFDDTLVYSTMASAPGCRPRGITVVFFATRTPDGLDLGDHLKEHFKQVAEAEELWLVAPLPLAASLDELVRSPGLKDRLSRASALSTARCITFDASGSWELHSETGVSDLPVGAAQPAVQAAGMRALFAACSALLTAHAGLHFGKPSGKHSTHFLRAGAVAERSVHAHFVAAALLSWADGKDVDRIWVDTAAISSVAYALSELRQALTGTGAAVVDSFGGYNRVDDTSFATPGLALISASTSGGLSRELEARGVAAARQRTLYYVGEAAPDTTVLCDMTARGDDPDPDLIPPFQTWPDAQSCERCVNGQNVVVLHGDSFAPTPGLADPLQLKGVYSDRAHRDFITRFAGTSVVALRRGDGARQPTVRALSFHFRDLIHSDRGSREEMTRRLENFLPFRTRYLVHPDDPDSAALASLAADLCAARGLTDVEVIPSPQLGSRPLDQGISVVTAGVVGSGRELLNISRELRQLISNGGDLAYFVGCARPASLSALQDLRNNLTFKADKTKYPFTHVWYAQAEPHTEVTDPWLTELRMLTALDSWMGGSSDAATAAVDRRLTALTGDLGPFEGFLASDFGSPTAEIELRLNPNFALWDPGPDATAATHAEIYFTLSTVLHRSRHSNDGRYSLFEQPGFGHVLAPTNFDRFNDPVIQAAILRGARGTELRFIELPEQSTRMAEVIATSIENYTDEERGGAALEFALSLLRGVREDTGGAIRLTDDGYRVVHDAGVKVDFEKAPVLARTLAFFADAQSTK